MDIEPMAPDSALIFRHSDKEGDAITPEGRERALEVGRTQLAETINATPENAIILCIGTSNKNRTRQTLNYLVEGYESTPDAARLINSETVGERIGGDQSNSLSRMLAEGNRMIEETPSRVLVQMPMFVRGLDTINRLAPTAEAQAYHDELDANPDLQTDGAPDIDRAFNYYMSQALAGASDPRAPTPDEVGKAVQDAVTRIHQAAGRHLSGANATRPLVLMMVGHSWGIDAAVARYVSQGDITHEGAQFLGETLIGPSEGVQITFTPGRDRATQVPTSTHISYRDQERDLAA